ncbi:MAG: tetratricopeptide repeat protein [Nitrospinaceae bacterium]
MKHCITSPILTVTGLTTVMIQQFIKLFTVILVGMILTQCENKNSAEYVQEAIEYSKQGQFSNAKKSYLKAIESDPKNTDGYYGLGGMYNLEKKYKNAEKAFKSALQLDPTHINAWYSLGYTYELMGKKEDSESSYEKHRRLKEKLNSIIGKKKP